jgi:hypothetical protein
MQRKVNMCADVDLKQGRIQIEVQSSANRRFHSKRNQNGDVELFADSNLSAESSSLSHLLVTALPSFHPATAQKI